MFEVENRCFFGRTFGMKKIFSSLNVISTQSPPDLYSLLVSSTAESLAFWAFGRLLGQRPALTRRFADLEREEALMVARVGPQLGRGGVSMSRCWRWRDHVRPGRVAKIRVTSPGPYACSLLAFPGTGGRCCGGRLGRHGD